MNNWKTILFFTLLALAVIIQLVVLHWSLEAVFFVTWFLLMLGVKHDTRLSPAIGLIFLATCPFLLIADNEPAAEQAANYAYFFLAIGVMVQVEEMILERNNRLGWKFDISFLWQREGVEGEALTGGVHSSRQGFPGKLLDPRWILIIGLAGLVLFFLLNSFSAVPQSILIPLLGGSILFIFFVIGLRMVLMAYGVTRLARVAWLLVLLPAAVMGGIWINNLINTHRLTRMEVAYNFIDLLENAGRSSPAGEGEVVETQVWMIGNEYQQVLFQHPARSGTSQITFPVRVEPGALLIFDVATSPESWESPGDGVEFKVYVNAGDGLQQIFSTYINPKANDSDQRWHPHSVDLKEFAGQEVILVFETSSGQDGDYRFDWAGWGEPRILVP